MKRDILLIIAIISFSQLYSQTNLDSGLVGYYPLNGNADDASVSGFNGTVNSAVLTMDKDGNPNQAYDFDGLTHNITIPADFDYAERTISVWFNADVIGTTLGMIYSSDHNSLLYGSTKFYVEDDGGQKVVKMNAGNSTGGTGAGVSSITENTWYMVTIVASSAGLRYYLNCTLIDTVAFNNWSSSNSGNSYASLGQTRVNDRKFDGQIDDLRIYNRVLTDAEVCDLFSVGTTINEYDPSKELLIYPNPFSGSFKVSLKGAQNTNALYYIRIYDLQGKLIESVSVASAQGNLIYKGELPEGMFVVEVSNESGYIHRSRVVSIH